MKAIKVKFKSYNELEWKLGIVVKGMLIDVDSGSIYDARTFEGVIVIY